MTQRVWIACALALIACSDPPPTTTAPISVSTDGIRVHVGGRDVLVHCQLTCEAMGPELTRLSNDCASTPTSGPHRVVTTGPVLALACCQEASVAYDRACGHETLVGCASHWQASCEGMQPRERVIDDDDRGVTSQRGL